MKSRDKYESNDSDFDEFDEKIHQALQEEGVIIPTTVEDVRRAKARLKTHPVTMPPHLQAVDTVLDKMNCEAQPTVMQEIKIVLQADNQKKASVSHPSKVEAEQCSTSSGPRRANDEFVEAIAIAQLTRLVASLDYPLSSFRQNKLIYLAHRKADEDVKRHYSKQPAGPYNPWSKFRGPEKIAQDNGYIRKIKSKYFGYIAGKNIDKINDYVCRYPVCSAIDWVVGKFRYEKSEDLELLTTVDFAALDLLRTGMAITKEAIKTVIATNENWAPKLDREIFSDDNIERALRELCNLFPATYHK